MVFPTKKLLWLLIIVTVSLKSIPNEHKIPGQNTPEFVILIASFKNEKFAVENLRSACFQKSSAPYQVIYVNDCSTDKTAQVVDSYIKENGLESLVTVIHNKENVGQVANYYNTIHSIIPDHKIVVTLDGDDLLAHNEVLLVLEKYYADPDIWMTWGSMMSYPAKERLNLSRAIPKNIIQKKKFREHPMCAQHLRTFRAKLFKKIQKSDLFYKGSFIKFAGDLAFMFPMLEMSSPVNKKSKNHSQFISDILYYYRTDNPISDFRVHLNEQNEIAPYIIKTLKPYDSLESLD